MAEAANPRPRVSTPLVIGALLLIDGLHFVFARSLRGLLPPATAALYVLATGTLQIAAFGAATGRRRHCDEPARLGVLPGLGSHRYRTSPAGIPGWNVPSATYLPLPTHSRPTTIAVVVEDWLENWTYGQCVPAAGVNR